MDESANSGGVILPGLHWGFETLVSVLLVPIV